MSELGGSLSQIGYLDIAGFEVRLAYKDNFIGTMPPNLRFDTYPQYGCPSFRYRAFGRLRGGLPPRTAGPDSSRQTAIQAVAIPCQR